MPDRVALDTNVLDWLLQSDHLATLIDLRRRSLLEPIVTAEVAHEVHRMKDEKAAQRDALQRLIAEHFKPVKPTWVPIVGLARLGMAYVATPRTEGLLRALRERGLRKLDALHVTNAHFHQCVAFLTLDERLLRKEPRIRDLTALTLERPELRVHEDAA